MFSHCAHMRPMDDALFTSRDAWRGGFYELALELGARSDERLAAALCAVWAHPDLEGPYAHRDREPSEQALVAPALLEEGPHLRGVARLPNGSRVACGTCVIRELDDGPDWLDFYIPMGSLGTAYAVGGFRLGPDTNWPGPGRSEVEEWLATIGSVDCAALQFQTGPSWPIA